MTVPVAAVADTVIGSRAESRVLFDKVSVVARPTKVSVDVGSVNVPVLEIVEITGDVSV